MCEEQVEANESDQYGTYDASESDIYGLKVGLNRGREIPFSDIITGIKNKTYKFHLKLENKHTSTK